MAHFETGPNLAAPVGINRFIRSTKGLKVNSHTVARDTVPTATLASGEVIKVLQPGTVMARITSGADAGMVGPYASGLTGGFEFGTITNTATGGDFTIDVDTGRGDGVQTTGAIAWDATDQDVTDALEATTGVESGDFITTLATDWVITWQQGGNQVDLVVNDSGTGGTIVIAITDGTAEPAIADGRQTAANIVGVNQTYLPTQLNRRNVEIGVIYAGVLLQDWCLEHAASGLTTVALTNTTADTMRSVKGMDILFFDANPEVV